LESSGVFRDHGDCDPGANAGWFSGYVNDTQGAPIAAALISAGEHSATTDTGGYYNMTLSNGTYDVTAEALGYQASTVANVTVSRRPGDDVELQPWCHFRYSKGHVTDAESGDAVSGVVVTAWWGMSPRQVSQT